MPSLLLIFRARGNITILFNTKRRSQKVTAGNIPIGASCLSSSMTIRGDSVAGCWEKINVSLEYFHMQKATFSNLP